MLPHERRVQAKMRAICVRQVFPLMDKFYTVQSSLDGSIAKQESSEAWNDCVSRALLCSLHGLPAKKRMTKIE